MAVPRDKGDLGLHAQQLRACSVQPVICFNKHASRCEVLFVAALVLGDSGFLAGGGPDFIALRAWMGCGEVHWSLKSIILS